MVRIPVVQLPDNKIGKKRLKSFSVNKAVKFQKQLDDCQTSFIDGFTIGYRLNEKKI